MPTRETQQSVQRAVNALGYDLSQVRLAEPFQNISQNPSRRARDPETSLTQPIDILRFFEESATPLTDSEGILLAKNGQQHPAREYWTSLKVNPEAIDKIVDKDGRFHFRIPDEKVKEIMQLATSDPRRAAFHLIHALGVFYDNNDLPLHDSVKSTDDDGRVNGHDGMNTHNAYHAAKVAYDANHFLAQATPHRPDITPQTHIEAALAAAGHDSGQIIQRDGQEDASIFIMEHAMPYLVEQYPDLWRAIKRAILVHPEANFRRLADEVWHTTDNAAATIQRMHDELTPAELALALADKWDIGQHRLPNIWRDPEGIIRDFNIGPNLGFSVTSSNYSEDGTVFSVNMQYNFGLEDNYFAAVNETYAHTPHPAVKHSKRYETDRLRMPNAIDQYLRDRVASHSEVLEAMMWGGKDKATNKEIGYRKRLRLAIMLAFALNPNTKFVDVNISDNHADRGLTGLLPSERIDEIQSRQYRFTRENLDEELDAISQKFANLGINLAELKSKGRDLRPTAPIEAA